MLHGGIFDDVYADRSALHALKGFIGSRGKSANVGRRVNDWSTPEHPTIGTIDSFGRPRLARLAQ
jgi:hypothetical protein